MVEEFTNPLNTPINNDINLFDLLGWGIDAATGAMTKPDQRAYEIMFAEPKANATE